MSNIPRHLLMILTGGLVLAGVLASDLAADGGVVYRDIAAGDGAGITFRRAPSTNAAIADEIRSRPIFSEDQLQEMPMKARGAPGVALLDYDLDGDLDIYVANGPGASNSLYSNQLNESGATTFIDVGIEAGVDATDLDTTGVCYGDLDNDGDPDLLIVSHNAPNRLFANQGPSEDGMVRFADVTALAGLADLEIRASSGCTMGDIDGDGLLDIAIANTYHDWSHYRAINSVPFELNQHTQLLRNTGAGFVDISATSGVEILDFAPEHVGKAAITWGIAFVDIDLDGDVDLVNADDQAGIPEADSFGNGFNRGMVHVLRNDGTGRFTDTAVSRPGAWMGLSFGDLDCNGTLDLFATNFGDYVPFAIPEPGNRPSRWLLQLPGGNFEDPNVGELITTPFGWGNAIADYDNDGDLDIIFHGGLDVGPGTENSNAGVILQNSGCTARFGVDLEALAGSTDHVRRTVQGMALGDLDQNGLIDIVSVSGFDLAPEVALDSHAPLGSPFDSQAFFVNLSAPDPDTGELRWAPVPFERGTLSVELGEGEAAGRSVGLHLVGTVGRVEGGRANRDAIGAVVRFESPATPGLGTMLPVLGGASYASQSELTLRFGMGDANEGRAEILWPGGTRNRVDGLRPGETLTVPEIPCSFDDASMTPRQYVVCLLKAFDELRAEGLLEESERGRLFASAIRAREDALGETCTVFGEFLGTEPEALELEGKSRIGAEGGIAYVDIAAGDGAGIIYRRQYSPSKEKFDAIKLDPPYTPEKAADTPMKSWGAPGVALIDYDRDGDLDIYVTNGPGAANSLYSNQLRESGEVGFVDVAEAAGVAATAQDSTGVCFGDTDNDGDPDLLVLSHNMPHLFYENLGPGEGGIVAFAEHEDSASGLVRAGTAVGCSFGDVNGDGLLDVAVGNSFDNWDNNLALNVERFLFNDHNQLFLNTGGNVFTDASAASGVQTLAGFPPENGADAGLTWAVALVDLDQDGDLDLVNADDQSGFPTLEEGGVDRGLLHLLYNDGNGNFTDVSLDALGRKPGAWMGTAYGDFNCDGYLDIFGSNFGDFNPLVEEPAGRRPSRWFLGTGDGQFMDPGVGTLRTTPFGWGASAFDYDNDGDLDIVYHGGIDVGIAIEASNFGVVLRNPNCSAQFEADLEASLSSGTDHGRRTVHGMASGDLDGDGFVDIVSVSNFNIPEDVKMTPDPPLGSPFDPFAQVHFNFEVPDERGGLLEWVGSTFVPGTLSIELARPTTAETQANNWAEVRAVGTIGITSDGQVNRDGIGALVRFFPRGFLYPGATLPVLGGASYASQDALARHFGMGRSERGIVDVHWPGGVKNRLYGVRAGERLVFPEIPCSYDDASLSIEEYSACLLRALDELRGADLLGPGGRTRFLIDALRARRHALGVSCEAGVAGAVERLGTSLEIGQSPGSSRHLSGIIPVATGLPLTPFTFTTVSEDR